MTTELIGIAGMTNQLRKFYQKALLSRTVPNLVHNEWAKKDGVPSANGKAMDFRRLERPSAATTALTEGTPPSVTQLTWSNVVVTVDQYGAYSLLSDVLETQAIDPQVTSISEMYSEHMKVTLDILTRNVINAGTTVQYSTGATSRGDLISGDHITYAELREAVRTLRQDDVPPAIDGRYYACIIGPETEEDLFGDSTILNIFQNAQDRGAATGGANSLQTGALGDVVGLRFFSAGSNVSKFASAGRSGADVFAALVIGGEAYAVVDYQSMPGEVIVQPKGSAGTSDPLKQVSSIGWKAAHGAKILDENRILRLEHVTTSKEAA